MGVNAGHVSTVSAHFLFGTRLDILLILSPFPFSSEARPKQRKPAKSTPEQQTCSKWPKTGVVCDRCWSSAVLSPPFPQLPASRAWLGASPPSPPLFRLLRRQSLWACCLVGRAHWVILQLGSLGLGERTEGMRTDRLLSPGGPTWIDEPFQGFLLKFGISGFPGHCFILLPAESEF